MRKIISFMLTLVIIGANLLFLSPKPAVAATPVYKYEWMSQSGTVSPDGRAHQYTNLKAGDTINLSLTLINRSGLPIHPKSALRPPLSAPQYQVPIGSWGIGTQNPQDGTPYFLDTSSFILNNNRFVYFDNENLGGDWSMWVDGQSLTMSWTVKLANNLSDGVYDLYYRPVCEYSAWTRQVKNGQLLPTNNSDIFTRFIVGSGVSSTYLTYTDQHNYFSIQYPADWIYTLQPHEVKKTVVFSMGEGDIWGFFVIIEATNMTLQQNADAKAIEKIDDGYTVEKSNTTISGQPATTIHYYSTCCGGDYYETLVVYKGRLYILSPHGSDSNQSMMFNSFRFI